MATAFTDVKPWPDAKPAPVVIGSNSGAVPLDERIVAERVD